MAKVYDLSATDDQRGIAAPDAQMGGSPTPKDGGQKEIAPKQQKQTSGRGNQG